MSDITEFCVRVQEENKIVSEGKVEKKKLLV
jgi:hypothetical protein